MRSDRAMVVTVDRLATEAGVDALRRGGTALDAAVAANAVLAVTLPNQCGLGGDLFAVVHRDGERPRVLEAAGRAGSGAVAGALRDRGLSAMPPHEVASVTVPGCVDGWAALHADGGRLPWPDLFTAAHDLAADGFAATPFFAAAVTARPEVAAHLDGADGPVRAGRVLRRPETARVLADLADGGPEAFYGGSFGAGLRELGAGLFTQDDLMAGQAHWAEPVVADALGMRLWTPQPPSAGYLTLASAWIAERLDLPADPDDGEWPHLLVEAMRQAAYDRSEALYDGADGAALVAPARLASRAAAVRGDRAARLGDSYRPGGTTYLSVVDEDRTAVSLIQSNAMGFGSGLVVPGTGVWLHNRGIGFSLRPGDPNELAPGRRPAHTLSPLVVTDGQQRLVASLGTRGGDSQPQVLLQLLVRLLGAGQAPAAALAAPRWTLRGEHDRTSFDTWGQRGRVVVEVEDGAPTAWTERLRSAGHVVEPLPRYSHAVGHANLVLVEGDELVGAAEPRATSGVAAGP